MDKEFEKEHQRKFGMSWDEARELDSQYYETDEEAKCVDCGDGWGHHCGVTCLRDSPRNRGEPYEFGASQQRWQASY